ncbi:MAG: nitrogenase component 1, partial [Deferribacterota bacterium]|nr:nitrogenase component 1 [Deferribacterota bacterium]
LWNILPLFKELNIRVLSKITGDSTYNEITYAHHAKCSVVICSQALLSLARKLKTVYNIPFIQGSFYSMRETKETLLSIADLLDDKQLKKDVLRLTCEKEKETLKRLMPYKNYFKGKKAFIYSGGVKSWSFVYLLEELGFEVVGTSIRKSTDNDIERLENYFLGKNKILIGQESGSKILDLMEKYNIDILLAGGRNKYNSVKGKIPFIDINQEREHAYSGYEGIIRLAKDIYNEICCPVFKIARGEKKWVS